MYLINSSKYSHISHIQQIYLYVYIYICICIHNIIYIYIHMCIDMYIHMSFILLALARGRTTGESWSRRSTQLSSSAAQNRPNCRWNMATSQPFGDWIRVIAYLIFFVWIFHIWCNVCAKSLTSWHSTNRSRNLRWCVKFDPYPVRPLTYPCSGYFWLVYDMSPVYSHEIFSLQLSRTLLNYTCIYYWSFCQCLDNPINPYMDRFVG